MPSAKPKNGETSQPNLPEQPHGRHEDPDESHESEPMDVPPPSEQDHVRQRFDVEIVKQYALVGPAGVVSRKFYEDTEQALDNAIASQMLWFAIMPVWVQQAKD